MSEGAASGTGRGAVAAVAAALGFSLLVGYFSLPPFEFGHWPTSEPVVLAFDLAGLLASLSALILLTVERGNVVGAARHPFVLIPACLAVVSLIFAAFAKYPMVSILGSPQSGQGVIWYFNLAVFVLAGLAVSCDTRLWRAVVAFAVLSGAGVAVLKGIAHLGGAPLFFSVPDFVAVLGLTLPVIVHSLDVRRDKVLVAGGWIVAAALIAVSKNVSAMAICAGMAILGVAAILARRHWREVSERTARAGGALIVLVSSVALYGALFSWDGFQRITSLKSRILVARIMDPAIISDPVGILVGHGWGHTQEAMFLHLRAAGQRLWNLQWDFLWSDFFHSHNWLLESLYSTGILGAVLTLAFFVALPMFCAPRKILPATLFGAAYAAFQSVWFDLPFAVPFVALAYVSLTRGGDAAAEARGRRLLRPAVTTGLVAIALLQAGAVFALGTYGLAEQRAIAAWKDHDGGTVGAFPSTPRGDELPLALASRDYLYEIQGPRAGLRAVGQAAADAIPPARRPKVRAVLDRNYRDLAARIPKSSDPILALSGNAMFADIFYSPALEWLKPDYLGRVRTWRHWLDRLIALAPERTDAAIPYLSWSLAQGNNAEVETLARSFLARAPNDPVAQFYFGAALLNRESPDQRRRAIELLKAALDNGIEKLMPVADDLKRRLGRR